MMRRTLTYLLLIASATALADLNCTYLGGADAGVPGELDGCGFCLTTGYSFSAQSNGSLVITADSTQCRRSESVGNVHEAGQTGTVLRNFIVSVTPLDRATGVEFQGGDVVVQGGLHTRFLLGVDYFDGMGKHVRSVTRGVTPSGDDLVTGIGYDPYGREYRHSLPAPAEAGTYPADPFDTAADFYSDSHAYTETIIESSPLERVLGHRKAGDGYNQHPSSADYKTNTASDVRRLYVRNGTLTADGFYSANSLFVTESADEDGHRSSVFTDFEGRTVMTRQHGSGETLDTYFVYDDVGRLGYVLPPLASGSLPATGTTADTAAVLRKYAYVYKYDGVGNCTEKRLPGCEPTVIIYDKFDRVVLSQSGNQRADSSATAYAYDKLGRMVYTAVKTGVTDVEALRAYYSSRGVNETLSASTTGLMGTGYSSNTHTALARMLSVRYYDKYDFLGRLGSALQDSLAYAQTDGFDTKWSSAMGMLTGERVYSLDCDSLFAARAYYYDRKGRTVQIRRSNLLGGFDNTFYRLSFTGKTLKEMRCHSDSLYRFSELYTYAYDHADRLVSANYRLGQRNEIALVRYSYDELGRISQKESYDKTLGTTNYTYNIQSQITSIDANYYDKHYHYADLAGSGAGPLYNGDVSECVTLAGGAVIDSVRYSYDDFDRVTAETNLAATGKLSAQWEYDSHSNVTNIERTDKNGVLFDDLDLTYYGNQIDEVNDSGDDLAPGSTTEYRDGAADIALYGITGRERLYDANGNMTADLDRKLVTVRYNLLNLPDTVQFFDGSRTVNRYLADGTKVSSVHHTVQDGVVVTLVGSVCNVDILPNVTMSGTAYCQNIEYDISGNGTPVIKRIHNSEGFVTSYAGGGEPYYTERDIQGNVTSVWHAEYGYPAQMTDYYADGLPKNNSYGTGFQPYLYSGKELQRMHGYDCYDYGARHSQTSLGRFTTIDPLAENDPGTSPYALCGGNPVRYVDLDGREIKIGTWYGRLLARFGVDNFESKVQRQLNIVKGVSKSLNTTINKLENSKSTYNIKPLDEHPNNIKAPNSKTTNNYLRKNKTIYYNPDNKIGYDGEERPAEAALAHELGHAENDEDGLSVQYDITKATSGDIKEQQKIDQNELNSIEYENQVRESFGYPERTYDYFNQSIK